MNAQELITELRAEDVCLTCGNTESDLLEWNEPPGRQNSMAVQVHQCACCHRVHTEWQYRIGLDLDYRGKPRSKLDRDWAHAVSVPQILAQLVRMQCECLEPLALEFENAGRAAAIALDLLDTERTLRHPGPDPARNDLRQARAKREKRSIPAPKPTGEREPEVERAQFATLCRVIADLNTALFSDIPHYAPRLAKYLRLADSADQLYERFEQLREAGELAELTASTHAAVAPSRELTHKLSRLQHPRQVAELAEQGAHAAQLEDETLDWLVGLLEEAA